MEYLAFFSFIALLGFTSTGHPEDLPNSNPVPESNNVTEVGIFDMVNQHEGAQTDWRQWPIDSSKGNAAKMETTVLHITYPYQGMPFNVYAYQLPDGGAGRPWATYVWVDRGPKYRSDGISPTPTISCSEYDAERWEGLEDISEERWKEIHKISSKIVGLPLSDNDKTVSPKRIHITQRLHPFPAKLTTQGGALALHELALPDNTHITAAPSVVVQGKNR